jgi:hypothetical protein
MKDYFSPFFSPMRNASAKNLEMIASFNNNLTSPFNDVMVNPRNPENPDSKPLAAARIFSIDYLGGL